MYNENPIDSGLVGVLANKDSALVGVLTNKDFINVIINIRTIGFVGHKASEGRENYVGGDANIGSDFALVVCCHQQDFINLISNIPIGFVGHKTNEGRKKKLCWRGRQHWQ
ncbi:MAG TPA: hypothetical protein VFW07_26555 [Parafilimonas sp.]|nr:hypothetical protein [Parafilimonas sp.]